MTRKEKIELLNGIKTGKADITHLIIKNSAPLPSWYWQDFETTEELINDLKKQRGANIVLLWHDGKPYVIDNNPKRKQPKWFNNE